MQVLSKGRRTTPGYPVRSVLSTALRRLEFRFCFGPPFGFLSLVKLHRIFRVYGPGTALRSVRSQVGAWMPRRNGTSGVSPWRPNTTAVRFLDQEFELHPSGMGLSEEMALFGTHEPVATRVYLEHLNEGNHVLDVGSNLGYYLLLAAHAVGARGQVLGFEPATDVYAILKRNINRSNFSHIQVFPWAIGERDGSVQFYESEVPNWGSIVQDDRILQNRTVTVPVKRLDDLLKQFPGFRPDVLRMDVEGGEIAILEGAQRTFREVQADSFHRISRRFDRVETGSRGDPEIPRLGLCLGHSH